MGYSPRGRQESDTTERLHFHFQERDSVSISGPERPPGGGYGNPLQYSCLENSMDRGAWKAMIHRVAKSET